jgi:hypothetical protein
VSLEQTYAPGSRVRVRGEEWAVEKSLLVSTGLTGRTQAAYRRGWARLYLKKVWIPLQ